MVKEFKSVKKEVLKIECWATLLLPLGVFSSMRGSTILRMGLSTPQEIRKEHEIAK